jgi:hypothetical protein
MILVLLGTNTATVKEMGMIRRIFFLALLGLLQPNILLAQLPHIIGSWKLNGAASIYPGPLPQSQVRTYSIMEDDFLLGVVVTVDAQGKPDFLQVAARPDGRDYPEYDSFLLAQLQMSDKRTAATYSEQPVDDRTVAWVDKMDGVAYITGTRQVSEDGQSMVIEFEVRNPEGEAEKFRLVYDKQ